MVGRIIYQQEGGRAVLREENLCGLPVLTALLFEPPGLKEQKLNRQLGKLERKLCSGRVDRVILPGEFPYTEKLSRVTPVDVQPFYRAAADLFALHWLEHRGMLPKRSRVALSAPGFSPELADVACRLCRAVREVRIDVPGEWGEQLAFRLQRQFGVPVVPQGANAELTLSFSDGDLRLSGEKPEELGWGLAAETVTPPSEVAQQVLALLWERGRLKREGLQVIDLL